MGIGIKDAGAELGERPQLVGFIFALTMYTLGSICAPLTPQRENVQVGSKPHIIAGDGLLCLHCGPRRLLRGRVLGARRKGLWLEV